jgi:hypothetical protein
MCSGEHTCMLLCWRLLAPYPTPPCLVTFFSCFAFFQVSLKMVAISSCTPDSKHCDTLQS